MSRSIQKMGGMPKPVLAVVASLTFLGAVGLVLPAATETPSWMTPLIAAFLAAMMLFSIAFHLRCREKPLIVADVVLCVLAAVVAYGRFAIPLF